MFKVHRVIVQMLALMVLSMAGAVLPAGAGEMPPSVTVRYDDLNLRSAQGVASLYKRIENAATEVCRPAEGPQSVSRFHWTAWNECFYHAIATAVRAVHSDKLSAYHWQRAGAAT